MSFKDEGRQLGLALSPAGHSGLTQGEDEGIVKSRTDADSQHFTFAENATTPSVTTDCPHAVRDCRNQEQAKICGKIGKEARTYSSQCELEAIACNLGASSFKKLYNGECTKDGRSPPSSSLSRRVPLNRSYSI